MPGHITPNYPKGGDLSTSAMVVITRSAAPYAIAMTPKITLDGFVIAHIGVCESLPFYVSPGLHTVGTSNASVALNFEAGEKYGFLVSIDIMGTGFELERLSDAEASSWQTRCPTMGATRQNK